MLKPQKLILGLTLFALVTAGCKKDDDVIPEDEQELITTIQLTLTNVTNSTETVTATWRDIDGPGGADPVITGLTLRPNVTYTGRIEFLDESNANSPEDITEEVEEEGADHEIFYEVSGANLTVTNRNTDANGLPLGTSANFASAAASTGTLTVILKHKPGSKAANDPVTKGETDIEAELPVQIQ
ncbi:hypothetical protein Q0590_01035 [Rhodocytophaga aerolata]|uniref:Type 1 periplasmic binding fold superfamily protein n=1 Tax=Rhodocytophaga aerolata TaxID=455078 RepID=A0ABT8QYA0_9BACT|nr:hypothetical protein [Rhodocytophaga aerolata]MDO1444809.1 hypothetical protein [Rhodocytophaga aerolata]